ncbi:MAG: hypothetical protein Q7R22_011385 [Verrucomicrobiota bacterium JB025]|nr:hypothetical protein [Verrucomicrobiota bacterium JB025]
MSDEPKVNAGDALDALAKTAGLSVYEGDGMPTVTIAEDLNETAKRLGEIVSRLDLYELNEDLVYFDFRGACKVMTPKVFCTWINDHVLMAKVYDKKSGDARPGMLGIDQAAVILSSQNFRRGVRGIKAVNHVRLPVIREDGALEKLPDGYDEETETFTVPGGIDYPSDISIEAAKVGFGRVDGDFPFADERGLAVQRAAMLAVFCKHLPGGGGLRPGFLWLGNKPGCGKSVLAKACLYPVLGSASVAKMKAKEDLDKELEAFCRAGVPYIFLDNVYGGLSSSSLDQLLTSETSTGRALGGHALFEAENRALVLVTGNRLELNEDAARRFLIVDLFETGEPDERKYSIRLDDQLMKSDEWRAEQLGRMWAIVRHWHSKGMPKAGKVLPTYERFSETLGGIVVAAGYEEPFQRAEIPDAISPEKSEFNELLSEVLKEMDGMVEKDFTIDDLTRLARAAELFVGKVGTVAEGVKLTIKEDGLIGEERSFAEDKGYLDRRRRTSVGKLFAAYVGQVFKVNGRVVEFGDRPQSRKSTYTVTVQGHGQ